MTINDVHLESNPGPSAEDSPGYDALSLLSIENTPNTSSNSTSDDSTNIPKLTPLKNSEIGALIPLGSKNQEDALSEDSMSIKSFGDDQDYASALSSVIATPQPPNVILQSNTPKYPNSAVSSVVSAQNSTLSREDLKLALLSVMERKEELQVRSKC